MPYKNPDDAVAYEANRKTAKAAYYQAHKEEIKTKNHKRHARRKAAHVQFRKPARRRSASWKLGTGPAAALDDALAYDAHLERSRNRPQTAESAEYAAKYRKDNHKRLCEMKRDWWWEKHEENLVIKELSKMNSFDDFFETEFAEMRVTTGNVGQIAKLIVELRTRVKSQAVRL